MTQSAYDVVIVGAGPAGSSAAYYAAKSGLRVALVDRTTFPRDKVCGDGISSAAVDSLKEMGLGDWIEQQHLPQDILLTSPNGQSVQTSVDIPGLGYGRIVKRLDLDEVIMRRAVEVGADLYEGVALQEVIRLRSDLLQLHGKSICLQAPLLITADGSPAPFTKKLGLIHQPPDMLAIRAYYENVTDNNVMSIHWDKVLIPGYAWIFPLGNGKVNVGIGTYATQTQRRQSNFRSQLDDVIDQNLYLRRRLHKAKRISHPCGFPLRTQMNSSTAVADNIMVVGDAAGLINPLNGEGIAQALLSGKLAAKQAKCAIESNQYSAQQLAPYVKAIRSEIGRSHFWANGFRMALGYPWLIDRMIHCAQKDRFFADILTRIIIEIIPNTSLFHPRILARLLLG